MSFDLREIARMLGKPVELYRFTRQSLAWRYTSGDVPVTVGAETFTPLAISRDGIRESYERAKRQIKITMPKDAPVAANWAVVSPADVIRVTVLSKHRDDAEMAALWTGRVMQPRFTDTELELTCQPGTGPNRPRGLQLLWQRGCPLALYSQGPGMCNLLPADFDVPATLDTVVGNVVTASEWAALAAGRLAGGYLQFVDVDGLTQTRTITFHSGATVHLEYAGPGIEVGLAVTAFHGCAHDFADCTSKGNGPNYGGCTKLPVQNPFSGVPIWW